MSSYPYLHVGSANDLTGFHRRLYRALEILPGVLAWTTLMGVVVLSWLLPVAAAIFIILFDLYWLIKTIFLSAHLRANWKRMRHHLEIDWEDRLENMRWDHIWQLVIIPFAREPREIVEEAVENMLQSRWPKERMMIVLAAEEAAGEEAKNISELLRERYKNQFGVFFVTTHPQNLSGEMRGKGSNETWALKHAVIPAQAGIQSIHEKSWILNQVQDDKKIQIDPENVLVSSFDVDTRVPSRYFLCLTWHFLTAEYPHRSSFQPVPLYHNNIWEAPALSRVVAMSGTFWQMMQQERPERLTTFSSHSMSLKSLMEVGGWQKNIVSEDSRIFWNHYLFYNGDYRTVPLSYPVSMDANIGKTFWQTIKQVYKQQRRWGWGVENVPYVLFGFFKQKAIPLRRRLYYTFILLEGFWSWATNALIIFLLGWLPLVIGGEAFNQTILSYNLPRITRLIMTLAMIGLVTSAIISISLLLTASQEGVNFGKQKKRRWWQWGTMAIQWIFVPITILLFGALPGLEAQTRLMLGGRWRLGFWLTPKHRK